MAGDILRTVNGGYNKADVLSKIDAYTVLIMTIDENLMSDAAVNAELLRIREMPLRQNKKGMIFSKSGFSIEDTDAYFEKLENEIMKKIFL